MSFPGPLLLAINPKTYAEWSRQLNQIQLLVPKFVDCDFKIYYSWIKMRLERNKILLKQIQGSNEFMVLIGFGWGDGPMCRVWLPATWSEGNALASSSSSSLESSTWKEVMFESRWAILVLNPGKCKLAHHTPIPLCNLFHLLQQLLILLQILALQQWHFFFCDIPAIEMLESVVSHTPTSDVFVIGIDSFLHSFLGPTHR